jgi:hypothetical protein
VHLKVVLRGNHDILTEEGNSLPCIRKSPLLVVVRAVQPDKEFMKEDITGTGLKKYA